MEMSGNSSWSRLQTAPMVSRRGRRPSPSRPTSLVAVAIALAREEGQPVLADLHLVPVLELRALDPAAVHVGAVEAVLVVDVIAVVPLHEHRVAARDGDVVQEDLVLRAAPDTDAIAFEAERLPRSPAPGADDQGGTLDTQLSQRDGVVVRDVLRREGHRRVRARLVVNEQGATLGAVIRGFGILKAAFGTM